MVPQFRGSAVTGFRRSAAGGTVPKPGSVIPCCGIAVPCRDAVSQVTLNFPWFGYMVPRFHRRMWACTGELEIAKLMISFPGWAAVRNMKKKKILKFWRAEHAETEERCQGHSLAATRIPSFQPLKWNSCCCRPGRSFKEVVTRGRSFKE